MRKITKRDLLALATPAVGIPIFGIVTAQARGWLSGVIISAVMIGFVVWVWLRQIRKYPEDTWRFRI